MSIELDPSNDRPAIDRPTARGRARHSHPLAQPLAALFRRDRLRVVLAVVASSGTKVMDVMPELLIGAAVDVVVKAEDSFVGTVLGVESRFAQIGWIAAINAVVWILESPRIPRGADLAEALPRPST